VYAGCVYWPFQGHTFIGSSLGLIVLVAGVVEALVNKKKES